MRLHYLVAVSVVALATKGLSAAALGHIDPSFNLSPSGPVWDVAVQSDKRIIVGGSFTNVNGIQRRGIARVFENGEVDETFNADLDGGSLNSDPPIVRKVCIHTNGQIYITGTFRRVHGVPRQRLARLNPDGTLDDAFSPIPYYVPLSNLAVQEDGKVIFGAYQGVGRLNWDGSPDTNFSASVSEFGEVDVVAIQDDGKVLIGGDFVSVEGVPRESVARLNADASVDMSFDTSGQNMGEANRVLIPQEDGTVLMGGDVVAKLTPQGRLSPDFARLESNIPAVLAMVRIFDRILIGGNFSYYEEPITNIVRLTATGEIDPTFHFGNPTASQMYNLAAIQTLCLQPDGRLLVGGSFTTYDGEPRQYFVRLFGEQPALLASQATTNLVISWPSGFSNWVLQTAQDVSSTNWQTITNLPVLVTNQCFVTNAIGTSNRFFRLIGP